MKRTRAVVAVVMTVMLTGGAAMARDAVPGDTIIQLATTPRQLGVNEDYPGMWEYVYDVVGTTDASGINYGWTRFAWLEGFDANLMPNRWNDAGERWDGTQADPWNFEPKQRWSANSRGAPRAFSGGLYYDEWHSMATSVPLFPGGPSILQWAQPKDIKILSYNSYEYEEDARPDAVNQAWYADNPWHEGGEYAHGNSSWPYATAGHATWTQDYLGPGPDGIPDTEDDIYSDPYVSEYDPDGVSFENQTSVTSFFGLTGLLMTMRIVHPNSPGDITWGTYSEGVSGTILGPGPGSTLDGDFDGDGDVDADDVDDLCANMGGDPGTYDMDGDGDVDEDDMTFHVENYLEYDSNGDSIPDGQGTFRGDFNRDGSVNGTDLSIMNGNFGSATGFAGGNANCDATVNGTDLSILAGVFGSVATSAVPEPMTITLLSLSGLAILRRRNR